MENTLHIYRKHQKGRSLGGGTIYIYMGGCQNYGPFLATLNPKRDHNFDNHPYTYIYIWKDTTLPGSHAGSELPSDLRLGMLIPFLLLGLTVSYEI